MTSTDYRTALEAACREYERLLAERTAIDLRLSRLHETIGSLTRLCGYTPTVPWGLTDAIRIVVRRAEKPLCAVEVRDRLAVIGLDLSKYANELSAIHTVLKRLHRAGELQLAPSGAGEHAYRPAGVRTIVLDDPEALVPFDVSAPPAARRRRKK